MLPFEVREIRMYSKRCSFFSHAAMLSLISSSEPFLCTRFCVCSANRDIFFQRAPILSDIVLSNWPVGDGEDKTQKSLPAGAISQSQEMFLLCCDR